AASASDADVPERRYSYDPVPDTGAYAAVLAAMTPPRDVKRRPPDVEPESFYQYDAAVPAGTDLPGNSVARNLETDPPPPQGAIPELIYSYTPTPEPAEPTVSSAIIPPTPELVPEARFTYTPPEGLLMRTTDAVVPNIPTIVGWTGLRMPGRVVRYALGG